MDKKPATGLKLFENARSYSEAAKLLCNKAGEKCSTENTYLNHSAAIYAGLAIEYYLKALYFVEYAKEFDERGKTPHDFYALYSSLKHKTRKNLEYQFFNLTSKRNMNDITILETTTGVKIPRDLKETLRFWTESFVHLRIHTAPSDATHMFFFFEMEEIFTGTISNKSNYAPGAG